MTAVAGIPPTIRQLLAHAISWGSLAVYGFLTSTIVFRATGQENYGIWATIAAFRAVILFLDGGLAFGVTRDASLAANGNVDARERLGASFRLYAVAGIIALVLGATFSWLPAVLLGLAAPRPDIAAVTAIVGIETSLALVAAPGNSVLRGLGRFDLLAVASAATAMIGTVMLLVLTPNLSLIGASIALVAGRLSGGLIALAAAGRLIGQLWRPTTRPTVRRVIAFALPLWAVAIGSAIGMATDVPIVGAFFGPEAAGAYGVGAIMPSLAAAFVFVLLDTAFPRLTTMATASIGQVTRVLSTIGVLVAAIGLGAVALSASDLLTVWLGVAPDLAIAATAAYAVVWILNVPTHVLVLSAIARYQHHRIGHIVIVESIVNVVLSLLLAAAIGPIGPAIATVVTVGVSNAVVLPALLGPKVGVAPGRLLFPAVAVASFGLLLAVLTRAASTFLDEPPSRVALNAGVLGGLVALIGVGVVAKRAAVQRWLGILFDGGWRVLLKERAERVQVAGHLENVRAVPWPKTRTPLVTIRIATYNRGSLVAERAIASALAQTHSNIEVVVVGDRCDEATEAAVRAVSDPRIRFENLPHRGDYPADPMFRWMVAGAAPMNRALEMARGEWIAPLDDDDEFTTDHVEVLLDACLSRGLDVAYGRADMEVRTGEWQVVGEWPPRPGGIIHASAFYSLALRSMLHNVESWRLNEPGDWNLWRRMLAAGARFGFVDRVVVKHYLEYREVLAEARR